MERDIMLSCWVTQLISSDCLPAFFNAVLNKNETNGTDHFILVGSQSLSRSSVHYYFNDSSNNNISRGEIILCIMAKSNKRETKRMGKSVSTTLYLEIRVSEAGCLQ